MMFVQAFLLVIMGLGAALADCPPGWTSWGTKYYRVFNNPWSTWMDARSYCYRYSPRAPDGSLMAADLVNVASYDEHVFILNFWKTVKANEAVWIGYNDMASEGQFVGTDGRPPVMTFWDSGEPNNDKGKEDCVVMWKHNGLWNDENCYNRYPFICEIEA